MRTAVILLCWIAVSVRSSSLVDDDDLVGDFRQLLGDLLREANKKLSGVYALPEVQEELITKSDGWVSLRHGYLDNLKNMTRDGDCIVQVEGHTARATAYVYFNEMPFSYTVTTDSTTYPNVSAHVRGELCSISGKLVVTARLTDTTAVTARFESFHLESPIVFMYQTNYTTIKPGNDFSFDLSTAFHEMLKTETTPYLQRRIANVIKAAASRVTFRMMPVTSTTSTSPPTTTTRSSTVTSSKGSTGTSPTTSNDTGSSGVTPSEGNIGTSSAPSQTTYSSSSKGSIAVSSMSSKGTSHLSGKESTIVTSTPGKTTSFTTVTPNKVHTSTTKSRRKSVEGRHVPTSKLPGKEKSFPGPVRSRETVIGGQISSRVIFSDMLSSRNDGNSGVSEGKSSPRIVITITPGGGSEYPPHNHITCDVTTSKIPYRNRETAQSASDPSQKEWLTENFNRFFDLLLEETDRHFTSSRSEFLSLPDDEEEMYVLNDGSVTLADGGVCGLDHVVLEGDPVTVIRGALANATVRIDLSNVTYSFEFSAKSKTYANHSLVNGTVSGNMTGLRGQLTIVANLTDVSAVRAMVSSFQLLPTVEFPMDVAFAASSAENMTSEIRDAVVRELKKNVAQELQKRVAEVFRGAVSGLQEDLRPPTTPTSTTSSTTGSSSTPTTTSAPTTKPSAAANVAVSHISFLIPLSLMLFILLT